MSIGQVESINLVGDRIEFVAQLLVLRVLGLRRDTPSKLVKVIQRATDRGHAVPNSGGVDDGKDVFVDQHVVDDEIQSFDGEFERHLLAWLEILGP